MTGAEKLDAKGTKSWVETEFDAIGYKYGQRQIGFIEIRLRDMKLKYGNKETITIRNGIKQYVNGSIIIAQNAEKYSCYCNEK